jgi:3D (Asp-Asp-Asp) domain-containing protein
LKNNYQNKLRYQLSKVKLISVVILAVLVTSCSIQKITCHSSWKTTGFYTPLAKDFPSHLNKKIAIRNYQSLAFNSYFLKSVKLEGWGKTRFGWYLGHYSNQWHKANNPLNALGHPLKVGAIAVDNKLITKNTLVNIPNIQSILGIDQFHAVDVGSAIKNKHIDIYTGEGDNARKLSYKVTGKHQVCY